MEALTSVASRKLSEEMAGELPLLPAAGARMSGVDSGPTAGSKRKAGALELSQTIALKAAVGPASEPQPEPVLTSPIRHLPAAASSDHSEGTHCSGSGAESSPRSGPATWRAAAVLPALPALDLRIPTEPALTCAALPQSPLLDSPSGSPGRGGVSPTESDTKKPRLTGPPSSMIICLQDPRTIL